MTGDQLAMLRLFSELLSELGLEDDREQTGREQEIGASARRKANFSSGRYAAIDLVERQDERLPLSGEKGEIWQDSTSTLWANG